MISLPLFATVNQATFWTYRSKDVAARNDIRRLDMEKQEMYWYREATIMLYELFVAMTDTATGHQYDQDRAGICSNLAAPVENMIHRLYYLQELEYLSAEQQGALKECQQSLQQVSDYILPIAFPIQDMPLGSTSKLPVMPTSNDSVEAFSTVAFSHMVEKESPEMHQPSPPEDRHVYEGGCFTSSAALIGLGILLYYLFIH